MQNVYISWKLKKQENKQASKLYGDLAWNIINVCVQEGVFDEVPNALVVPNHLPAACAIKIVVVLFFISSF